VVALILAFGVSLAVINYQAKQMTNLQQLQVRNTSTSWLKSAKVYTVSTFP